MGTIILILKDHLLWLVKGVIKWKKAWFLGSNKLGSNPGSNVVPLHESVYLSEP